MLSSNIKFSVLVEVLVRIVFIGATHFSQRVLAAIHEIPGVSLAGTITNLQNFRISYSNSPVQNVLFADVYAWSVEREYSCYVMEENMSEPELQEWLVSKAPDLLVVAGWFHMVPKPLREISPAIGMHASLLPDYSGGAPLVWAMMNGEKKTGISLFQLEDGVDSGPVFSQAETRIFPDDTIATLYSRIEDLGLSLLRRCLPEIANDRLIPVAQDESRRRIFPQRCPDDGKIDWNWPARRIHDFVRAQTKPYPGAFTFFRRKRVIIWESELFQDKTMDLAPGTMEFTGLALVVVCGDKMVLKINRINWMDEDFYSNQWALKADVGKDEKFGY